MPLRENHLDTLDFLLLEGCALQRTVIRHNSSLGRAAKASQRLLLVLEFLQRAPACIAQLRQIGNAALAQRLQSAEHDLQSQLPTLIFNATLGGDEYHALWLAERAPMGYPRVAPRATTAALCGIDQAVRRWLGGDYRALPRSFELQLADVAGGDGGARLQALPRQPAPEILRDYLQCVGMLERRLAEVLPQAYRDWQRRRTNLVTLPPSANPA